MCTGRIDQVFILEGFLSGADGIFAGGWQLGECHYQVGNYDAIVADHFIRRLLKESGINADRFTLDWASAAEAPLYVELITKFTQQIKDMGPLGSAEGISLEDLKVKMEAGKALALNKKLRTRFAMLTKDLRAENDYSAQFVEAKITEKLDKAIVSEMEKIIQA